MKLRASSITLALGSAVVMAIGVYFALFRPPLLPEDLRYLDRSIDQLRATTPALAAWLRHVFWVLGSYMFATGVITCYLAVTAFRARARGAGAIVTLAGAASVGGMAVVNFLIDSDHKWHLLLLALVWLLALAFYRLEGARGSAERPAGPSNRAKSHSPTEARATR